MAHTENLLLSNKSLSFCRTQMNKMEIGKFSHDCAEKFVA